jgi:hypothetical protein
MQSYLSNNINVGDGVWLFWGQKALPYCWWQLMINKQKLKGNYNQFSDTSEVSKHVVWDFVYLTGLDVQLLKVNSVYENSTTSRRKLYFLVFH